MNSGLACAACFRSLLQDVRIGMFWLIQFDTVCGTVAMVSGSKERVESLQGK